MGEIEHEKPRPAREEIMNPRHFYAAYVFDQPNERVPDFRAVVEASYSLGYPVRYWWLSQAMDLRGAPDRLIICVHHPSASEEAGMDLYDARVVKGISWD